MQIRSVASGSTGDKNFSVHFPKGRGVYLYILFRAKTMLFVDGKYISVQPGTGIFYDKNQFQSYYCCDETGFNHDYVSFDLDSEEEESVFSGIPLGKPVFHVDAAYITGLIALIEQERYLPSRNTKSLLTALGLALLYKAGAQADALWVEDNRRNSQYAAFYRLREEIYKNPAFDWSIERGANGLFLSRFYFQKLYKQFFGVTFQMDLICARISQAKKLLQDSNHKIGEIAGLCGYKNAEHFTRQFTKQVGATPREYRNRDAQ